MKSKKKFSSIFNIVLACRYIFNLSDKWELVSISCEPWDRPGVTCFYRIKGVIPERTITRGPRKGQPDYRTGQKNSLVLLDSEFEEWQDFYESQGNCPSCNNSGEVFTKWTKANGAEKKKCDYCNKPAEEEKCDPT